LKRKEKSGDGGKVEARFSFNFERETYSIPRPPDCTRYVSHQALNALITHIYMSLAL